MPKNFQPAPLPPLPADTAVSERKKYVRRHFSHERRTLSAEQASRFDDGLVQQLRTFLTEITKAEHIAAFISAHGEIGSSLGDPAGSQLARLCAELTAATVWLPAVDKAGLVQWREFGNTFTTDSYGITCPVGTDHGRLPDPTVAFIPAVAVDTFGNRLGRGGGHYDRQLSAWSENTTVIAVVHPWAVTTQLPTEHHDLPVDGVITSEFVHFFDSALR